METQELTALSVFAGFVVVLLGIGLRMLYSEIAHQVEKINMKEPELALNSEIKQEIYDLLALALEDVVGNMQMPTAVDHLAGFASMWAQKKFLGGVPPNIIEGVTELAGHGQAQEWQEEVPN